MSLYVKSKLVVAATIVLTAQLFSAYALAGSSSQNLKVQKAMKSYVNTLIDQNGFLPVVHQGKVLKLNLKTSSKYPDGFHAGV